MRFDLYLESGPRRRTTMVHVPSLPGCIARGSTTEDALERTPAAIRARLDFLGRHGEPVAEAEPIELVVVEHVTDGTWLGNGAVPLETDAEPLGPDEARRQLRWARWSRDELLAAARAQPGGISAAPAGGGRTAAAILAHVAGSEQAYLSSALGPLPGLNAAVTAVERAGDNPWAALAHARALVVGRAGAMTDEELARVVRRGREIRSARRMLRRMLEHEWEHVLELRARLEA